MIQQAMRVNHPAKDCAERSAPRSTNIECPKCLGSMLPSKAKLLRCTRCGYLCQEENLRIVRAWRAS